MVEHAAARPNGALLSALWVISAEKLDYLPVATLGGVLQRSEAGSCPQVDISIMSNE